MTENPYPPGSAELAEWEAIAAAPAAHGRRRLDPAAAVPEPEPRLLDADALASHASHARALSGSGVLFGPDCSQYQGQPDWGAVRASGCVIGGYKVSEGRTFQDPTHQWNRARVPANGLIPLAYHFLYYSDEYASNPSLWGKQADWFASLADPKALHALDVEAAATAGHHLGVKEWVAEYRRLFPGHALGCYTNRALWENRSRMPYDPAGLFDWIWHAGIGNGYYTTATGTIAQQWAATGTLSNSVAGIGYPTVKLWQITDHARVPGVGGSFCDGNAFQGTLTQLKALAGEPDMPITTDDADLIITRLLSHDMNTADGVQNVAELLSRAQHYAQLAQGGVAALAAAVAKVAAATDTLEASDAQEIQALSGLAAAAADPSALADAIATRLGGSADAATIKAAVTSALDEHLATLRIVSDTTTPTA